MQLWYTAAVYVEYSNGPEFRSRVPHIQLPSSEPISDLVVELQEPSKGSRWSVYQT